MPLYMIQFSYTPEAKAALVRTPEDRSVAFGKLVEDMGGRLQAYYNSLGDYDGVAIFEAPDEQTAHSIELATNQPGHLRETRILTLLPVKESVEAMHAASRQEYKGPRGWLSRYDEWAKSHPM